MELQTTNNQQVQLSTQAASSQKLIQCLIKMEGEGRSEAKMELIQLTNELMPAGRPQYTGIIKYPMIADLVKTEGKKKMLIYLTLLVKDFCAGINVVRNMNEDQMIEAGSMLMEECENFRLEDYVMMFTMAKRGAFHPEVKIYDRMDVQTIALIMDEYWIRRKQAGSQAQEEEIKRIESLGNTNRQLELMNPQDAKMIKATEGLATAMETLRANLSTPMSEQAALADIHRPSVSYSYGKDEQGNEGFQKNGT